MLLYCVELARRIFKRTAQEAWSKQREQIVFAHSRCGDVFWFKEFGNHFLEEVHNQFVEFGQFVDHFHNIAFVLTRNRLVAKLC